MPPRVSLTHLPIEILAEILLYTRSPPTVVAISRTCSFLYRSLALNPDASFIWRSVRRTANFPLHDPVEGWKGSEAAYVAFVFSGGVCEVCRKNTREMYLSFSARVRLCGSWHCRQKFLEDMLVKVGAVLQGEDRRCFRVPPLESTQCLYPSRADAPMWPHGETFLRKSDWEELGRNMLAYRDAAKARAEGKEDEHTKHILERCRVAWQRVLRIMEVSKGLIEWKWSYDWQVKAIKKKNETWTKTLADDEGWDLGHLVASQTYGSLQRRKNFLLETIKSEDVIPIWSTIESELLAMRARRQRQEAEESYGKKLTEVKKIYERMRCGTVKVFPDGSTWSDDPLALPPLSVFCALRSVRALKGSPDPSGFPPGASESSVARNINTPLAISLIMADVRTWLIPVRKQLMALLGYPNGWQSASTRAVHPLKRATARFFCRRCGERNVGKGYERELCLDFKGVCSHVCKGSEAKKPPDWTVDMFVRDDKAISVVKRGLGLARLAEDSQTVDRVSKMIGPVIRCMTCKGMIVMDLDTAIGHAHRHESMEIEFVPTRLTGMLLKRGESVIPTSRLGFERGNVELLLGPCQRAKRLCKMVNYGCRHCFVVLDHAAAVVSFEEPGNKGARAMTFHGLRSHVKEKHGVRDIRDEDFFCYTRILEVDRVIYMGGNILH